MISQANFEKAHLEELHRRYPLLTAEVLEMTLYAFCLLQALADSGLPFIFKGGTSLLLLLKEPQRISTDVDILCDPKTPLEAYLQRVRKKFPFSRVADRTKDPNGIVRHYAYPIHRQYGNQKLAIRLDVLLEDNPYAKVETRALRSPLLLTSGLDCFVRVPSIDSLLGDKLTAFAPKTIGVNPEATSSGLPTNNHLQVIKQLFDVGTLFEEAKAFTEIERTYRLIAQRESFYRGGSCTEEEALRDSFEAAFSIATGGLFDPAMYARVYKNGIAALSDHLFERSFNASTAKHYASNVMLLTAGLLRKQNVLGLKIPAQKRFSKTPYSSLKSLQSKTDFDRCAYAIRLWNNQAQ